MNFLQTTAFEWCFNSSSSSNKQTLDLSSLSLEIVSSEIAVFPLDNNPRNTLVTTHGRMLQKSSECLVLLPW